MEWRKRRKEVGLKLIMRESFLSITHSTFIPVVCIVVGSESKLAEHMLLVRNYLNPELQVWCLILSITLLNILPIRGTAFKFIEYPYKETKKNVSCENSLGSFRNIIFCYISVVRRKLYFENSNRPANKLAPALWKKESKTFDVFANAFLRRAIRLFTKATK